jgi:hypothetical protein
LLLALGCLPVEAAAQNEVIEWGIQWRTRLVLSDSHRILVLGTPTTLPVTVLISNTGSGEVELSDPEVVLKVAIRDPTGVWPALLSCEPSMIYHAALGDRMENRSTIKRGAEVLLSPKDGVEAHCAISLIDQRLFPAGTYRVEVATEGWPEARVRYTWWDLEIRQAQDHGERTHQSLAEGHELFRVGDFAGASKYFEAAVALAPEEPRTTLSLVTAYDRLRLYDRAIVSLNRAIAASRGSGQAETVRLLHHRLAMFHVLVGDEEAARRVMRGSGFSDEEVERTITVIRGRRLRE